MEVDIAAASMSMAEAQFSAAYDTAMIKKSMDSMASQAEALINEMLAAVPAPGQYGFDVYG